MAETTHIEWTDATWNPITGCSMVSAGCTNCYAQALAGTRLRDHPSRRGLTRLSGGRHVWTGEVRLNEDWMTQPLRWRRPRRIFVCAHGDLFHEAVPDAWIDRVFAVMALAPQHQFQVLTKRPERAREYLGNHANNAGDIECRVFDEATVVAWDKATNSPAFEIEEWQGEDGPYGYLRNWPLPNVWLGTSVEDQATADARIPHLLATPAAVRFISAEPLLGPVDFTFLNARPENGGNFRLDALRGAYMGRDWLVHENTGKLDWVICGGESGPGARPIHPDWARSLRDQCEAAGVPFFFKQWGDWAHHPELPGWVPGDCEWPDDTGSACTLQPDGRRGWGADSAYMERIGKRAAGRLLDGRTHDAMPEGGA